MPNSHFRKDIGLKAGALNAQLPCTESHVRNPKAPCHKESEPEKIVTEGNLTAAHGLSDKRFETGLKRL